MNETFLCSGYGHIAPKTLEGRIATILYAIVGVPLTLLTITNLGGFMASVFRFLYKNICCGLCCLPCKRRRLRKASELTVDVETGASPTQPLTDSGETRKKLTWCESLRRVMTTRDIHRVSVPIYVSLLLIAGYIVAGALLFTFWEKDWDFFIGCYFSFITLTTIGFGDYVPGASVNSWDSQEKLVSCALYLIVGLSLIAMCFDLMQAEVKNMCKALARMIGILKDEESEKQKVKRKARRRQRAEKKRRLREEEAKLKLERNALKPHGYAATDSMSKHLQVTSVKDEKERSRSPSGRLLVPDVRESSAAPSTSSSRRFSPSDPEVAHLRRSLTPNKPGDAAEDIGKVIFIDEQRAPLKITIKRAYDTPSASVERETQPEARIKNASRAAFIDVGPGVLHRRFARRN